MALNRFPPPPVLPRPSTRYSAKKSKGAISSKFESGTVRQRNAFDDRRRELNVSFEFTQEEFEIFQSWWYYKIDNGASDFLMELYLDTNQYQDYVVKALKGQFSSVYFGVGNYRVNFQILVTTEEYMDEAALDVILGT